MEWLCKDRVWVAFFRMMNFSAKTEYACLAMLDLASSHLEREPVQLRRIADAHGIPSRFLVQILLQLKRAGFVQSTRGSAGGYRLTRPPQTISVWDIVCVMEGADQEPSMQTQGPAAEVLKDSWQRASLRSREVLQKTNFAKLAEQLRRETHDMYYI